MSYRCLSTPSTLLANSSLVCDDLVRCVVFVLRRIGFMIACRSVLSTPGRGMVCVDVCAVAVMAGVRLSSLHDTDTRWAAKGDELYWNGYKIHVTETCDPPDPTPGGRDSGGGSDRTSSSGW